MANSRHAPARSRSGLRRGTVLLGAVALLGLGMPSALAHDELLATSPADGTSVRAAPASVTLEFSGEIRTLGTEVLVTGPDGSPASTGTVEVVDGTVVAPLAAGRPAGTYTVRWRATSSDGHPLAGAFSFAVEEGGTATGAASPEAVQAPAGAAGTSSPSVGWLATGALLVAAGGVGVRRLRNRR